MASANYSYDITNKNMPTMHRTLSFVVRRFPLDAPSLSSEISGRARAIVANSSASRPAGGRKTSAILAAQDNS